MILSSNSKTSTSAVNSICDGVVYLHVIHLIHYNPNWFTLPRMTSALYFGTQANFQQIPSLVGLSLIMTQFAQRLSASISLAVMRFIRSESDEFRHAAQCISDVHCHCSCKLCLNGTCKPVLLCLAAAVISDKKQSCAVHVMPTAAL